MQAAYSRGLIRLCNKEGGREEGKIELRVCVHLSLCAFDAKIS